MNNLITFAENILLYSKGIGLFLMGLIVNYIDVNFLSSFNLQADFVNYLEPIKNFLSIICFLLTIYFLIKTNNRNNKRNNSSAEEIDDMEE